MTLIQIDRIKFDFLTRRAQDTFDRIIKPLADEDLSLEELGERIGMNRREVAKRRAEFEEEIIAQQLGAVLPDLGDDEYAALKSTVERFGFLVPAIVNKRTGNRLDGNHRTKIGLQLNREVPQFEVDLPVEDEHDAALAINVARRHLNRESLQKVVEAELLHDPTKSDRAIADRVGVSPRTVAAARLRLIARKPEVMPEKRIGKDGKAQSPGSQTKSAALMRSSGAQLEHQEEVDNEVSTAVAPAGMTEAQEAERELAAAEAVGNGAGSIDPKEDGAVVSPEDTVVREVAVKTVDAETWHLIEDLLVLVVQRESQLPEEWRRAQIDDLLRRLEGPSSGRSTSASDA